MLAAESVAKMAVTVTATGSQVRLCGNEAGSTAFSADLKTNLAHTWTSAEASAAKWAFTYGTAVHVYVALNGKTDTVETASTVGDQVVTFSVALSAS